MRLQSIAAGILLGTGLALLLAGCSASSPQVRHWTLPEPERLETTLPDDAPLVILARPGLPRYLARSALVVRDGAEIRVLAGERWSEAPESALQRALLLRLRIRQERAAVLAWPAPRAGRILNVRFSRLDGPRGGPLDVAATLSLEDVPPRTTQFRVPVADDSIPALVAAHGRALDRLADEAAAYLNAALP
jgi:uncharacterized lipoprotein YmbA